LPRLIGRRKLGRAVYFLFQHFRRAIIAHPVTAADAGICGVYEMSKRRRRGSKFRAVSTATTVAGCRFICPIAAIIVENRRNQRICRSHRNDV